MTCFLDSLWQGTVNKLKQSSPFSSSPKNTLCHNNPISLLRTFHFCEGREKRMKAAGTIDVHSVHNCFQLLKMIRSLYSGAYNLT